MKRFVAALMLPAFLLACGSGSNPFEPDPAPPAEDPAPDPGDEENPVTEAGIPESLAGDLTRVSFNPNTVPPTLSVEGVTLDDEPFIANYRRRPGLDRNGYIAFTAQDDPLDRHFTAYGREANNNSGVRAGVVVSGGVRNRFFGGGYYERDGAYTPPNPATTTGLVSYAGNYVGLINVGGSSEDLAPVPGGTDPDLAPLQAAEVTGNILIQADFADNAVEGNIYNRQILDTATVLPSIVLLNTSIDPTTGTFLGDTEYEAGDFPGENVIGTDIGDYGGIFGGTNASGVAGTIHLEQWDGPNNPLGFEGEEEYGVFVLDQCGQPVDDPICAGVNP